MFTGLISDLGTVRSRTAAAGAERFEIEADSDLGRLAIGASIACSGVCLTVVETTRRRFSVDVSPETLSRTTLRDWQAGRRINLERSLTLGDELGGHIVSGHVDGVATVSDRRDEGDSIRFEFEPPRGLERLIAGKGSVAVDGVSLTVNEVASNRFAVLIIPHTARVTTLGGLRAGDAVNLEVDMLARYVARLLETEA